MTDSCFSTRLRNGSSYAAGVSLIHRRAHGNVPRAGGHVSW